ncbi:MAG: M14 family metallocarboxypeptidase [Oscillospiraceae bacterium]|nr:M14 family metallocarboxypeptidase [Oscillospiraceae bacterium]
MPVSLVPTTVPFTSAVLTQTIANLMARYPLIRRQNIGQSIAGRDIPVLTFGTGSIHVSYNAAHHGNEWITTPVLLKFLAEYAHALETGGQVGGLDALKLYNASTLHLVPMVNPDGVDIATGFTHAGPDYEYATYLAQTNNGVPFPSGWKANGRGVDLNLQYPAGWERAREIKFKQGFRLPGPRDYVGSSVLSEPESRALYDYTLQHDFQLTLSYHSQGEVIYWKYLDYLPPRSREIGAAFAALSGYALETTPYESGHAGYKDWFIKHFNRPGYTIEVGLGESPLPLSQFDKIYADNVGLLATGLVIAGS